MLQQGQVLTFARDEGDLTDNSRTPTGTKVTSGRRRRRKIAWCLSSLIGHGNDVMKSKMAARGKFKSRNIFGLLLLLNVTFPWSNKICN